MLSSVVLTGYFGANGASGLKDFFLCKPGKYCPAGTAMSKVQQLDCLRGYFCPLGTAADLDLDGNFQQGIKQVNKWELIREIQEFLA